MPMPIIQRELIDTGTQQILLVYMSTNVAAHTWMWAFTNLLWTSANYLPLLTWARETYGIKS